MEAVEKLKIKLQQKKNRLAAEETRLALKERKMRTSHLIEIGGLVTKAELDYLPTNTMYGALIFLKQSLDNDRLLLERWTNLGKELLDQEAKTKTSIILKLVEEPSAEIKSHIRTYGLKWNKFRQEWHGDITDLEALKNGLLEIKFDIQVI